MTFPYFNQGRINSNLTNQSAIRKTSGNFRITNNLHGVIVAAYQQIRTYGRSNKIHLCNYGCVYSSHMHVFSRTVANR